MELFQPIREEVILKEGIIDAVTDAFNSLSDEAKLTIGGGSLLVLYHFVMFLMFAATVKSVTKVDAEWSKKLNKILNTNKWKVHIIKEKQPNAMAINGPHVFVTTGLLKLATENEVMAILLHEVYHINNHHIYKKIAYQYPLFYLCMALAVSSVTVVGLYMPLLVFVISNAIVQIPYSITIGRMHENKSDNYAIQMGYGKELASVMKKFEKVYLKSLKECKGMCKIIHSIDEAIDEHPPLKDRIETILRKTDELKSAIESNSIKSIVKFVIGSSREYGQTVK